MFRWSTFSPIESMRNSAYAETTGLSLLPTCYACDTLLWAGSCLECWSVWLAGLLCVWSFTHNPLLPLNHCPQLHLWVFASCHRPQRLNTDECCGWKRWFWSVFQISDRLVLFDNWLDCTLNSLEYRFVPFFFFLFVYLISNISSLLVM